MEQFPRLVTADIPGQQSRFYLVDQNLDFIPEVKEMIDQKVSGRRAPGTLKGLCIRLRWYYRFLAQRKLDVLAVKPHDLSDFVLWLSDPYRSGVIRPEPLGSSTINKILYSVASLYKFLVRRRQLTESPVMYTAVSRRWIAVDGDLLAHTRRHSQQTLQRMELKVKEPKSLPKTVSPEAFEKFISHIPGGGNPKANPTGFRNRLIAIFLRESGLRCGELLGIRMEDLDSGSQGVYVRFRPDNENHSRAKAGYGNDRFVHLPPEVWGLLDVYITEVWLNANYNSNYLWLALKENAVNRDGQKTFGKALTPAALNNMFTYYSKQSGVTIHPHMLRHTHATDLVRSYVSRGEPVDWKFIADRLGHSNVVTTMRIYTHLTKDDTKAAYRLYLKKKGEADVKRRHNQSKP